MSDMHSLLTINRCNRPEVFSKKLLWKICIFTEKDLWWSIFLKTFWNSFFMEHLGPTTSALLPTTADKIYETLSRNQAKLDRAGNFDISVFVQFSTTGAKVLFLEWRLSARLCLHLFSTLFQCFLIS